MKYLSFLLAILLLVASGCGPTDGTHEVDIVIYGGTSAAITAAVLTKN